MQQDHCYLKTAYLVVFLFGASGFLATNALARDSTDTPWSVIKSSDFGPPAAPETAQPSATLTNYSTTLGRVTGSDPSVQAELSPVNEASAEMYGQLAAQYLESARWNERRGEYESMLSNLVSATRFDSAGAHYELARQYIEGKHVDRDTDRGYRHLNAASGLGYAEAQRVIGRMHLRGDFGQPDTDQGVAILSKAAEKSIRALRELGMWYAGLIDGVARDSRYGASLLNQAASLGDSESAKQLARLPQVDPNELMLEPIAFSGSRAEIVAATPSRTLTPDQLFDYANAIMLQPQHKRDLEDEALAYAVFKLAFEQGHEPSGRELNYLDGIRVQMDRKHADWIDEWMEQAVQIMLAQQQHQ